ncbi:MAG: hypothetical protein HYS13_22545 [Planctomycetia bacterium]|nr:hypothetical protein [Planctomycetia bacterium]
MLRAWIACGMLAVCTVATAAESFPYLAFVDGDDAQALAGPGKNYYATGRLSRGELVEVYRHDAGGWCAIRPPAGSFSWVSSRFVKLQGEGVGLIVADGAVSLVGSQLADDRDVWHVKLARGEEVEVVGTVRTNFGVWYKIAPPAGEFRWVYTKQLQPLGEGDEVPPTHAHVQTWQTAADAARSPHGPASVGQECEEIDLALSTMVCKDCEHWSLEGLFDRAESAMAAARNGDERQAVRKVTERLRRFEEIRHEQAALDKSQALAGRGDSKSKSSSGAAGSTPLAPAVVSVGGGFDGRGRLVPVEGGGKAGAPRFALLDESGGLLYYVTPSPSVNLRAYVDKLVGIYGTRSYNAEAKAQQLTARRVEALSETKAR